jgi:tRNA-2-methylthio-N6-dimethylallyladenosine synthase
VRGREKSRNIAEIISDVEKLVDKGTKEIVFLGQNINTYGKGTSENLALLLEAAEKVEGLERIRYVTSHPKDLGEDLINQFGTLSKLCPSLHLPFQSGSDTVLRRMSRGYRQADYLKKVELLRKACPDIALSTDVIVGFPGETDADFEETLKVVREVRFSSAFMFKYSARPGTRAYVFDEEEVAESIKETRLKNLQDLLNPIIEEENHERVGTISHVLVEAIDKKGRFYSGRDLHSKMVHVLNAGEACVGKVLEVEITEANGNSLKGYYVGAPKTERDYSKNYKRGSTEQVSASL